MKLQADKFQCPSDEIASYIDGELKLERELELDAHFAECAVCSEELNQQKQFLCELDSSLKHDNQVDLPANFTKTVVANAESAVSGLRRPRERFNAIFICAALFLFILFALGADADRLLSSVGVVFEQVIAVGGFFGHLFYSIFIGVAIILRSFAAQVRFDLATMAAVTATLVLSLMFVSRRLLRMRRA